MDAACELGVRRRASSRQEGVSSEAVGRRGGEEESKLGGGRVKTLVLRLDSLTPTDKRKNKRDGENINTRQINIMGLLDRQLNLTVKASAWKCGAKPKNSYTRYKIHVFPWQGEGEQKRGAVAVECLLTICVAVRDLTLRPARLCTPAAPPPPPPPPPRRRLRGVFAYINHAPLCSGYTAVL